jgi:hypothetical protein
VTGGVSSLYDDESYFVGASLVIRSSIKERWSFLACSIYLITCKYYWRPDVLQTLLNSNMDPNRLDLNFGRRSSSTVSPCVKINEFSMIFSRIKSADFLF